MKFITQTYRFILGIVFIFLHAYGIAQIPVVDTVCVNELSTLNAKNTTPGHFLEWGISGGGTIVSANPSMNNDVEINWGSDTGTFEVWVRETDLMCYGETFRAKVKVEDGNHFQMFSQSQTEICDGDELTIGVPSWYSSYSWSTGATSDSITISSSGDYSLTVASEAGCSKSDTIDVVVNPLPVIDIMDVDPIFKGETTNLSLNEGGGMPYTYNWQPASLLVNPSADETQTEAIDQETTFALTVTDQKNCSSTDSVTVFVILQQLNFEFDTVLPVTCKGYSDGSISLTVEGGLEPYKVIWKDGNGNILAETDELDMSGLPGGNYNVTVQDHTNATVENMTLVYEPAQALEVSASFIQNVLCYGSSDGAVEIEVSGGEPGYTYQWSSGDQTQNVDGLSVGIHSVVVTDSLGCPDTLQVELFEPTEMYLADSSIRHIQEGIGGDDGEIYITMDGGTPGYTYVWNNGASSSEVTGLEAGTYKVTVTDMNECPKEYELAVKKFRIPNAFSPNSDGIYDYWIIQNINEFENAVGFIYNRWGQLVHKFKGTDGPEVWDGIDLKGKKLPDDTYHYVIYLEGEELFNKESRVTGHISIVTIKNRR